MSPKGWTLPGGGSLRSHGHWPAQPSRYRWIIDGHNAIFRHPRLEQLQVGDRRFEARRGLEEIVERFAVREGVDIQIVYDGNTMERNPDRRLGGRVRTSYSLPPDEEADDRIVFLVRQALERNERVVVVSSDRSTLGLRLPPGVIQVEPDDLFDRMRDRRIRREDGRPPGDYSDIEAHFLRAEMEERARQDATKPRDRRPTPRPRTIAPALPTPRPASPPRPKQDGAGTRSPDGLKGAVPGGSPDPGEDRSALERKKARGLEKHQRRLAALSKVGRGRKGKRK